MTISGLRLRSGFLIVFLFLVVMVSPVAADFASTPWPMYMHDLNHSGLSPFTGSQTNNTKWTFATGSAIAYGNPTLGSDGTIYIGSSNSILYALNPDGSLKWSYTTGGAIYNSPVIASDNTIYIGVMGDGKVYALNPNGTLKWSYSTGGSIYGSAAIGSDETLYVGSIDNKLYAIYSDGTLKWSYSTDDVIFGSSPAIGSDGTIYIGNKNGKLYAINPDGTLKWSYSTGGNFFGSPAIGMDGIIYIGNDDSKLYAMNPDGTLKWTYTGNRWNINTAGTSPAISADNTIYMGSYADGKIYAINPDGKLKWTYGTGNAIYASPTIGADGTVYIGSGNKYFYALNSDGTVKWSYSMGTSIRTPATIGSDGVIYIGTWKGTVYAFAGTVDYSADQTNGTSPLTVKFTGTSPLTVTDWHWDFGDGSTAAEQNPSHTYTSAGSFTVNLTITTGDGTNYLTRPGYITVTGVPASIPVASFTASPTTGATPLTVTFTDASTNAPTSWAWNFGDGSSSAVQNPVYTYTTPGIFTVSLNATNAAWSNTTTKTGYISVSGNPTDRAQLILSDASLYQDTATQLPIRISNITSGTGISFDLAYDPAVIRVNEITLNQSYASGSNLVINQTDGLIRLSLTSTDGINIGSLVPVFLLNTTSTGAVGSQTPLTLTSAMWSDTTFNKRQFDTINGSALVYRYRGDLNGNTEVDIGDTAKTAYMVVKKTPDLIPDADFNNNGRIDVGDATKIAWYLIGKILEL